jgi:hypothetical protein
MPQQHTENLFRRFKGRLVNIRSVSGEAYKGHVGEITNDYVLLINRETEAETQTFVLFAAIESVVVEETPA